MASDGLTRCVLQVCDAAGTFIEYWGFKAIHGRIWTLLALRGSPMSQVEIADLLDVSRSLVSGAVSELAARGLVRPTGSHRTAPYEAIMDVWPTISDVLRSREWMLLESARMALDGAIEEAEFVRAGGGDVGFNVGRMQLLLAMTDMSQALLRILLTLRMPRGSDAFATWLGRATQVIQRFRALR